MSAEPIMDMTEFNDWLYGQEGFGLRGERLRADLSSDEEYHRMLEWLQAAYLVGRGQRDELLEALKALVAAKEHKDANGKDGRYILMMQDAWRRARAAIVSVEKPGGDDDPR